MGKPDWGENWGSIEEALQQGYEADVVMGPHVYCEEHRNKIIELMEKYGPGLDISILPHRPERNTCLINGNLIFEDPHHEALTYDEATVVEGADCYNILLTKKRFREYQAESEHATIDIIRNMPVYGK